MPAFPCVPTPCDSVLDCKALWVEEVGVLLSQPGSSREWKESHTAAFGSREQEPKFPHQDLKRIMANLGNYHAQEVPEI